MSRQNYRLNQHQQRGVSLLVALIFLLIITVLAIANMREVSLESRITGNLIEQKQLLNVAEASVRDGSVAPFAWPHEPTKDCQGIDPGKLCLLHGEAKYAINTDNTQVYSPDDDTELPGNATWYAQTAPGGELLGQSENPEYGNMLLVLAYSAMR